LELAQKALKREKRKPGSIWSVDNSISPYDLYAYLKARFGPPNGLSMLFRSPGSDNLIQWHFTLKSGVHLVEFMGFTTRVEIWIEGFPNLGQEDWLALVKAIKADFKSYGNRLKKVRSDFEEWQLFYNPYKRLESVVEQYVERLTKLDIDHLELPAQPQARPLIYSSAENGPASDIDAFVERMSVCGQKYAEALGLCMSLRLITPIFGESFVNLLIFILARAEFKADKRLYDDYRRKEIDIRLKLLSVNCVGFTKPVDGKKPEIREFLRLMNERNDLLHGNTDPALLAFQTVYFDHMIPLFPTQVDFAGSILRNSLNGIEPATVLSGVNTVKNLASYISSLLEDKVRKQVELIMSTRDLGWRSSTRRIGVLFGPGMIEGYIRRR